LIVKGTLLVTTPTARGKKRFPQSPFADVPLHADPFVCSLPVDTLSHNFPYALLQAHTALSTISMQPFQFADALPAFDWQTNIRALIFFATRHASN